MYHLPSFIVVLCMIATLGIRSNSVCGYEAPVPQVQRYQVNDTCLDCICKASSNCDKSRYCSGDVCGMFRMTEPYWIDGGRHTVDGSKDDPSTPQAYQNCANDEKCARKTAGNYFNRYPTDCNGNHVIDCYDYAAVHKYGPSGGCQQNPIEKAGKYYTVLSTCLNEKNKSGNF